MRKPKRPILSLLATHPDAKANAIVQIVLHLRAWCDALGAVHLVALLARAENEENPMKSDESFDNSTCAKQIQLAKRELASFIGAVKELFGPEQARSSADDWLEECEFMDSPSRRTGRDWRAVTVAAAARLGGRLTVAQHHRTLLVVRADTKYRQYHRPNCLVLHASDGMRLITQGTTRK